MTEWEGQMVKKQSVCDITRSQIFSCVAQPFSVNKFFIIWLLLSLSSFFLLSLILVFRSLP